MHLLTIPSRCISQKWPRALALTCIFLLGVASIVGLYKVSVAVGEGFEKKLTAFGANIIISPKRETHTVSYGGIPLGDMLLDAGRIPLAPALSSIRGIALAERLALVAPKLVGLTRYESKALPLVGVDFEQEFDLKQFWQVQGALPQGEAEGLAGATLAAGLAIRPGDSLVLGGQKIRVTGVLAPTGSDDDTVFFVALPQAQAILQTGDGVSFIEVAALCSGCPIEDIVAELQNALPGVEVKALSQVVAQRMYAIHFARDLALLVAGVILLTACAMVVTSMLAAVNERRKEIGLLRAVGYSRTAVFLVFAAEALCIGMLAGVAGYGVGMLAGKEILAALHIEAATLPPFAVTEMLLLGLGSGLTAVIAASIPAWKASQVDPASALASL